MTDVDREIKRLISYIRSCREANIDCTVTIDKSLTHGVLNALEKIRQYREIGTVEEIKSVKKYIALKRRCGTPTNTIDLCAEYASIGTVEECREAVEKQKRKTPDYEGNGYADGYMVYDTWICPNCGKQYEVDYDDYDHCPKCGQAIQWDNLEGTEDENT